MNAASAYVFCGATLNCTSGLLMMRIRKSRSILAPASLM
ncbi:Uncharacterised protein [Bordetella pertussis]|nr:Uncharacterised protein [Bordetella pertussis]CPO56289.1 Uncharacterised protein [Bordetella pertussis]